MSDLQEILEQYSIFGEVVSETTGPLLKQIEFAPQAGTKLKNILAVEKDIARQMGVTSLRIEPVEGKNCLAFQIPAEEMKTIDFAQILANDELWTDKGALPICLGVDVCGKPVFADLAKMPHLLVAGTTGSGKSVGLNTFILSLMRAKKPGDVKFVMIDPKRIEFGMYNNNKYMFCPVVTENKEAAGVLSYLVDEMERRYNLLEENMCKNIKDYNEQYGKIPYIVCVIDEFADLMAADKNVSEYIIRLAQKARAAGIHVVLATQRPSVDVVTGLMKANFPTRLAYKVASNADSRTILDTVGAEDLIGRGDALFLASDGNLKRVHGAYMPDKQIEEFLAPLRATVKPLKLKEVEIAEKETATAENKRAGGMVQKKSIFRRMWDFWGSLRQKDKKLIVRGIFALWALIAGEKISLKTRKTNTSNKKRR